MVCQAQEYQLDIAAAVPLALAAVFPSWPSHQDSQSAMYDPLDEIANAKQSTFFVHLSLYIYMYIYIYIYIHIYMHMCIHVMTNICECPVTLGPK